ncbi:MAG TPA: ABC transporter permease [Bacilli bacterium]|nr:ABC transporter permease [Bacilli bacterium]
MIKDAFNRTIDNMFDTPNKQKIFKIISTVFKIVFIIFVVIILYLPIFVIALQSFNDSRTVFNFGGFTLKWYVALFDQTSSFHNREVIVTIQNTLRVTFLSTVIATIAGTLVAIGAHALDKKRRQQLILLNNVPILNAEIVTGMSLMLLFSLFLPILPNLFGFTTMLIAHIFFSIPYVVLSVLPKLKEIDANLYDAAVDLGCTPIKAIMKVILPSIQAGIFAGMLLAFTMSIDDFVISYFTTGNGFDNISTWIYGTIGKRSLSPIVYAYNTLLTLVTLIVLVSINVRSSKKPRKDLFRSKL